MTIRKQLRCIDYFRRVSNALLGRVLPEFGIPCGFRTLEHSMLIARRFAFVSSFLYCDDRPAGCVIRIAKPRLRRTESIKLAAPKSP
jgi:hypothetical protein